MPEQIASLGVLASGNGTNLQAIIDACQGGTLAASVKVVLSDKAQAKALERAKAHGIPAVFISPGDYDSRIAFDQAVAQQLEQHQVELVALAGYMRILSAPFIQRFPGRIVNVHPSLLPSFPGLDAIGQALAYGVKITGCTVHLVDEGVDTGPPLVQRAVAIQPQDTYETLAQRIHAQEHQAYIEALQIMIRKMKGQVT